MRRWLESMPRYSVVVITFPDGVEWECVKVEGGWGCGFGGDFFNESAKLAEFVEESEATAELVSVPLESPVRWFGLDEVLDEWRRVAEQRRVSGADD